MQVMQEAGGGCRSTHFMNIAKMTGSARVEAAAIINLPKMVNGTIFCGEKNSIEKKRISAHNHVEVCVFVAKRQLQIMLESNETPSDCAITLHGFDVPTLLALLLKSTCIGDVDCKTAHQIT